MHVRSWPWAAWLLLLPAGCFSSHSEQIDREIGELTAKVAGTAAAPTGDATRTGPARRLVDPLPTPLVPAGDAVTRVDYQVTNPVAPPGPRQPVILDVPKNLPGADAPAMDLRNLTPEQKEAYLRKFYPPVPPLPPERPLAPGPEGHPLSLSDLQRLAETYSPTLKTALAAVEAAKGAAKQAGAYPNPQVFFEQDTTQTYQGGYPGGGIDQVVKTAGKLKLQQAAAVMDVLNTQLALRRARSDLRYQVRSAYFGVLVARENIKISEALFQFSQEIYLRQVERTAKTVGAGYEPALLRPLVFQAQINLIQARNQFQASWKQLAANLGLPDMPPSEIEGRVTMPTPVFDIDAVIERLRNHSDVLTAVNTIQKSRYLLQLAKVTPIPDVDVHLLVQKDYTTPPFRVVHSLSVTVPVPIWDQNKGGIYQAESQLAQASVGPEQARLALINTLADAFNRYATAGRSVELTQAQVNDQVRAFRGLYQRWNAGVVGDVVFNDLVTAQQTLATYISAYVASLGAQWQAVVDVANFEQTDDLFGAHPLQETTPTPFLEDLIAPWGSSHHGKKATEQPADATPAAAPQLGPTPASAPIVQTAAPPAKVRSTPTPPTSELDAADRGDLLPDIGKRPPGR